MTTSLQTVPLSLKSNISLKSLHSLSTCAVAVLYCVLRPQTKDYR